MRERESEDRGLLGVGVGVMTAEECLRRRRGSVMVHYLDDLLVHGLRSV